jgi:hypothetical protein
LEWLLLSLAFGVNAGLILLRQWKEKLSLYLLTPGKRRNSLFNSYRGSMLDSVFGSLDKLGFMAPNTNT